MQSAASASQAQTTAAAAAVPAQPLAPEPDVPITFETAYVPHLELDLTDAGFATGN